MAESPFPGMDPYLESAELWPEVHSRLMVAIANDLNKQLSDKYRVAIKKRTYFSEPDESLMVMTTPHTSVSARQTNPVSKTTSATAALPKTVIIPVAEEVQERYLEVQEVSNRTVVTVIEVLSPKNKQPGEGGRVYQKKRRRILASLKNLVEIDLLRGGQPMPVCAVKRQGCYSILVSYSELRPKAQLYDFGLEQSIPAFTLPLSSEENSIVVDLQKLMTDIYRQARYHLAIDYSRPIEPELAKSDMLWEKRSAEEK